MRKGDEKKKKQNKKKKKKKKNIGAFQSCGLPTGTNLHFYSSKHNV